VATAPEATDGGDKAAAPKGKKKLMVIVGALVAVLALGGAGFYFLVVKPRAAAAAAEDGGEEPAKAAVAHDAHAAPPAYLPMDNMVVNLADPGGDRVAQIGVTLVVADEHTATTVKGFLPTIRSGVLMLISQKTATELLTPEGKETLSKAILREASIPFGGGEDEDPPAEAEGSKKKKKKAAAHAVYPVTAVLFSSFIVQ
jgi:flagellar FliL protein